MKIEPQNDGLEDDFPFPGVYSIVFPGSMLIFRGVPSLQFAGGNRWLE